MKPKLSLVLLALAAARAIGSLAAADFPESVEDANGIRLTSSHLAVAFAKSHPGLLFLAVDSMGGGKVDHDVLAHEAYGGPFYSESRSTTASAEQVSYSRASNPYGTPPDWTLETDGREIRAVSAWSPGSRAEPLILSFDTQRCYTTLLGLFDEKANIRLPAVLHLPGFGSLRITTDGASPLGYAADHGWVKVSFPAADAAHPRVEYRWTVAAIFPEVAGVGGDPRYDGFRRNWLNIFQLNPNRRVLANNTASDTCGFCYYEYADIARDTPPLADGLYALDMIRQSLERVFGE
jgi:hypothetical protein